MLKIFFAVFLILHGLVHLLYLGQSAGTFELQPGLNWPDGSGIRPAPGRQQNEASGSSFAGAGGDHFRSQRFRPSPGTELVAASYGRGMHHICHPLCSYVGRPFAAPG